MRAVAPVLAGAPGGAVSGEATWARAMPEFDNRSTRPTSAKHADAVLFRTREGLGPNAVPPHRPSCMLPTSNRTCMCAVRQGTTGE